MTHRRTQGERQTIRLPSRRDDEDDCDARGSTRISLQLAFEKGRNSSHWQQDWGGTKIGRLCVRQFQTQVSLTESIFGSSSRVRDVIQSACSDSALGALDLAPSHVVIRQQALVRHAHHSRPYNKAWECMGMHGRMQMAAVLAGAVATERVPRTGYTSYFTQLSYCIRLASNRASFRCLSTSSTIEQFDGKVCLLRLYSSFSKLQCPIDRTHTRAQALIAR